jgi:hypothetical protein
MPASAKPEKRDRAAVSTRFTDTEEAWLRLQATRLDMDLAELIRKCLALGIPLLLSNEFVRRVELKDAIIQSSSMSV